MKLALLVVTGLATAAHAFVVPHQTTTPSLRFSQALFSTVQQATNGASTVGTAAATLSVASAPAVAQRWRKSTKQVATLGPASSSKEMIEKLFLAGADVFRLNFSHGSQEQKKDLLLIIREIEEKYSHPIAILGDLQGPKLRVRSQMRKMKDIRPCLFQSLVDSPFTPLFNPLNVHPLTTAR